MDSNQIEPELIVYDPNEGAWAGTFRLRINSKRSVSLFSMHGSTPLQQWEFSQDPSKFEHQSDGLSIRIGYKRFVIDKSESDTSIARWRAVLDDVGENENDVSHSVQTLADDVIRYKNLLDAGSITRVEFDLLISHGAQMGAGATQINSVVSTQESSDPNLVEFQNRWKRAFGTLYGPIPTSLDERALFNALVQKKREIDSYKPDINGLVRWCAVNKVGGIRLLNAHKYVAEYERLQARGRPLPRFIQEILDRQLQDKKTPAQSLIDFAKMMGWGPMPPI